MMQMLRFASGGCRAFLLQALASSWVTADIKLVDKRDAALALKRDESIEGGLSVAQSLLFQ